MPAAPAAPPSTQPAGINIVGEKPPAPPPPPTTTIRATEIAPTATPAEPPKPGSAREQMFKALRAKAKPAPETEPEPVPKPATPPETKPAETKPEDAPVSESKAATEPTPEEAKGKTKTNPWKLVEQYKTKLSEAEKQIAEAKTASMAEQERKSLTERAEKAEARIKEYDQELQFQNFTKSDDFKKKYQEPYEAAWKRAMSDVKELAITDPTNGETRAVTIQDMMELVNLPLGKARDSADALFGKFADDVMAHRKEIRSLFEAQTAAIEEAKTKAGEWNKQRQEQLEKTTAELREFTKKTWQEANEAALKDEHYGKYFQPVEGDEDWNQRLAKGTELVDRAFSENPADPRLTPEQRALVIKRHAAVRNRARAFGPIRHKLEKAESRIAELEKELAQFKETTPPTEGGGSTKPNGEITPPKARDEVFGALRKIAKPSFY